MNGRMVIGLPISVPSVLYLHLTANVFGIGKESAGKISGRTGLNQCRGGGERQIKYTSIPLFD